MVTVTEKGILIEMQGTYYDAETIFNLTNELNDALQTAVSYQINETGGGGSTYYHLFDLLRELSPTHEQLKEVHKQSSFRLSQELNKKEA